MKTRGKVILGVALVLVVGGGALWLFGGPLFKTSSAATAVKPGTVYSTVRVGKGDIVATVSASGQLQPSTITTIRPDSNMPTRKVVKIMVSEGQQVAANQALVEIDATGLDLSLQSAEATYQAAVATLKALHAKPAGLDLAAAEATLASVKATLDADQEAYDNAKALVDKGLSSRSTLTDAERALTTAKASYESARLSYTNVQGQNGDADIQSQEAAVATADYNRQVAAIVLRSTVIRSPHAGTVAEVLVSEGDLVSTSTAIAYVVNTDPMDLVASVNESDMPSVKKGQTATITQSAFSSTDFSGVVRSIDLHAATSNNVSTFAVTLQVPNRDGKLLWGMNADAEISVISLKNVLTLPSAAIKTSNGASTVTILDGGRPVTQEIQIGATDGTRTLVIAGLAEGQEVVTTKKTATTTQTQQTPVMDGGPPGAGGIGGMIGGMMR